MKILSVITLSASLGALAVASVLPVTPSFPSEPDNVTVQEKPGRFSILAQISMADVSELPPPPNEGPRPTPVRVAPPPPPPPSFSDLYQLMGIVMSDGNGIAVLDGPEGVIRVERDARLGDATLIAMTARTAVFEGADEQYTLELPSLEPNR